MTSGYARNPASDGFSDHPHNCQCRIIGLVFFGEVIHRIEDQVDEISGVLRALRSAGRCFQQSMNPPFPPVLICGFDESVSEGEHQITGFELYRTLPVFRIREQSNWRTHCFEAVHGTISPDDDRRIMPGIYIAQNASRPVEYSVEHGRISVLG